MHAFVTFDFSVLYVASNSNSALPTFYRVAALWGAHEGSLLLWAWILAAWTLAVAIAQPQPAGEFREPRHGRARLRELRIPAVHASPRRIPSSACLPAPADGRDLNPVLQDPALAIHPPMLYMGYVGFAVAFAFACAAMLEGKLDQTWARWTRPWTTMAWCFPVRRHRARQLVGLLRARLGRLLVLGSGGERLVHALAGGHRADPFAGGHRKARPVQELDAAAGHPRVLPEFVRHLPGALRRADLGAFLRGRSDARHVHPGVPHHRDRRCAHAVRLARAAAQVAGGLRRHRARSLPALQQHPAGGRRGHGVRRHAGAADRRCAGHARRCRWARRTSTSLFPMLMLPLGGAGVHRHSCRLEARAARQQSPAHPDRASASRC